MSHLSLPATTVLAFLFALGLGSPAAAQICLILDTDQQKVTYPIVTGDVLYLNFRHSIYGSQVEEQFQIAPSGFRAIKLRYAESRLVEFYGYESATNENGWWVVHNPGREYPTLDLRASSESSFRVTFLGQSNSLRSDAAVDRHARLSVSACTRKSIG